ATPRTIPASCNSATRCGQQSYVALDLIIHYFRQPTPRHEPPGFRTVRFLTTLFSHSRREPVNNGNKIAAGRSKTFPVKIFDTTASCRWPLFDEQRYVIDEVC